VIVFDGYCNGASTKDQEHMRRVTRTAPEVILHENAQAHRDQGAFLANDKNKCVFVAQLIIYLQTANFITLQAVGDADTLIAETALQVAATTGPVTVVADDTDVLVLLVHHFRPHMADVFMLSEKSVRSKACSVVMPVRRICARIGPVVASALPLIHAISGCDTTSDMCGHGKASVFRKIAGSSSALDLSETAMLVVTMSRFQQQA